MHIIAPLIEGKNSGARERAMRYGPEYRVKTRKRILDAAVQLLPQYGFEAVADAMGMRARSKHRTRRR
jgi:hypothetical protein